MSKTAWYLGCSSDDVAERVILVGDPGRVPRLSKHLSDVNELPANRGLCLATGHHKGVGITVAAFGMGAPIAAIVMHELADLGCHTFVRIGTCIGISPTDVGDFVVARSALCYEGTSSAYTDKNIESAANDSLVEALVSSTVNAKQKCHVGRFASYDGFYRDMFAIEPHLKQRITDNFSGLAEKNVLAVDMETSALLTVGQTLNCKTSTLCVSSVNSITQQKMSSNKMEGAERLLMEVATQAITSV